jgi:hypothetical protein
MTTYESTKKNIEELIENRTKKQSDLKQEKHNLETELTKLESSYTALGEDLAKKVEYIHNTQPIVFVASALSTAIVGYGIGCALGYIIGGNSTQNLMCGFLVGGAGLMGGITLAMQAQLNRCKKLLQDNPQYQKELIDYGNCIYGLNNSSEVSNIINSKENPE